jgi:hypothetical protein
LGFPLDTVRALRHVVDVAKVLEAAGNILLACLREDDGYCL